MFREIPEYSRFMATPYDDKNEWRHKWTDDPGPSAEEKTIALCEFQRRSRHAGRQ